MGVSAAGVVYVVSQSVALLPGSDRCELIRASSYRPTYETCTRHCNFHTRDREKVSGERKSFRARRLEPRGNFLLQASVLTIRDAPDI